MGKLNKKIVIIEDEESQRNAMVLKLRTEGFDVEAAVNGKEGVRLVLEAEPDLVLLDMIMPVMDGVSALKAIRADERGKNIPVLVLTNLSEAHVALEGEDIEGLLPKADWHINDLVSEVKRRLGVS